MTLVSAFAAPALSAFLVFVLPGAALLAACWPSLGDRDWLSWLGLSAGLSAAFYPVWFLLVDLVGWHPGALLAGLPAGAAVLALAWAGYRGLRPPDKRALPRGSFRWRLGLFDWTAAGVLILLAYSRVTPALGLTAPLWGDSVHHTMITQLITEQGGLFQSWEPYARLQTFTYHFGFHSQAAAFGWLSGLNSRMSVLWAGQLHNFLAVVALYPLAVEIWRSRWAALLSILAAGLLLSIPMVYINWGRYTQLAAQVILPAAVLSGRGISERTGRPAGAYVLAGLCMAGLALTHYRILVFGAAAYALFTAGEAIRSRQTGPLLRVFGVAAGTILVVSPWFLRLLGGRIAALAGSQIAAQAGSGSVWEQLNFIPFGRLFLDVPALLWMAAILGWLAGLWLHRQAATFVALWWALIVLAANPGWLGLPGTGLISNFTVLVAAYIPVSLLMPGTALAAVRIIDRVVQRRFGDLNESDLHAQLARLGAIAVLATGVWGAALRAGEVDEQGAGLVTRADLAAAEWIKAHTPAEAVFYVNQFFGFADSVAVGSDAGWWLPLLAGRQITLPPINYTLEDGPRPDYIAWVNELPRQVQTAGLTTHDTLAMLRARGVTHIYVGQRGGRVNYRGPHVIDPAALQASKDFSLAYEANDVWIFELNSSAKAP